MESNNKAVKAIGFIIASSILSVLSFALSDWQESIFRAFSSIFFIIGVYQLSNAFMGSTRTFLKTMFWVVLFTSPILNVLNSGLIQFIDVSLYPKLGLINAGCYYFRYSIEILVYFVWLANSRSNKVKNGILLLLLPIVFYISISIISITRWIVYDDLTKKILFDYSNYFWSIVEFIGLIILIRAYSSSKHVSTSILFGLTGATLGTFIVLGDGFFTELAAFTGYVILLISLGQLSKQTKNAINVKRLRIAVIVASLGMLINMVPIMEWLGTIIEIIAYTIAISGYNRLHKSRGVDPSLSGFGRGVWAMVLLLLATLIHAIPSFGIGEGIAAMIGLGTVLILSTAWIKSLAAIKIEIQLSEKLEFSEKKQLKVEEQASASLG